MSTYEPKRPARKATMMSQVPTSHGSYDHPIAQAVSRSTYQPQLQRIPSQAVSMNHLEANSTDMALLHRKNTYVPVDPYRTSVALSLKIYDPSKEPTMDDIPIDSPQNDDHNDILTSQSMKPKMDTPPEATKPILPPYLSAFFLDTLPRMFYSHFLLRLPSLYHSRVARIFKEAEMTMPEIKKMALEIADQEMIQKASRSLTRHWGDHDYSIPSSPYEDLKESWESFITSLMREWKTLNLVSVLLLSAILTILQIDAAATDPLIRYTALASLICALLSLLYGCVYIMRFGTMRKTHKAAEWAIEGQKMKTNIWWNVWVMLAMPATWLAWSMILYIICIMGLVWRTGSTSDGNIVPLSPARALGPRVAISIVLILGIFYFLAISNTFRRYGAVMDEAWKDRVIQWAQEKSSRSSNFLTAGPRMDAFPLSTMPAQTPQYSKWTGPIHVPSQPIYVPPQPIHVPSQRDTLPEIDTSGPHLPEEDIYIDADSPTDSFEIQIEPPSRPLSPTGSEDSEPVNFLSPNHSVEDLTPQPQPVIPDIPSTISYMEDYHIPELPPGFVPSGFVSPGFVPKPIPLPAPLPFRSTKVIDLRYLSIVGGRMPEYIFRRGISNETWNQFINNASVAWNIQCQLVEASHRQRSPRPVQRPQEYAQLVIEWWNTHYFLSHNTQAVLCEEYLLDFPTSPAFAIYLIDHTIIDGYVPPIVERFGPIPEGLDRITVHDPPGTQDNMRGNPGGATILGNSANIEPLEGRVHFGGHQTLIYDSPDNMSEPDGGASHHSKEATGDEPDDRERLPGMTDANRWNGLRTALFNALSKNRNG